MRAAAALLLLFFAGCAQHPADTSSPQLPGTQTPAQVADMVTRSIYDNKPEAAREHFDDSLKSQIQDFQVVFLSQAMHRLGAYDGVKILRADPDHGRYVYRAFFTSGKMEVRERLGTGGKLSAYRIVPEPIVPSGS